MKNFNTLLTLYTSIAVLAAALAGCTTFGEPPAVDDATPPAGYAPVFLKRVAPMPSVKPNNAAFQLTSADLRSMQNVTLTLHLVDSSGTYYAQPDAAQVKKMICKVTDVLGADTVVVGKYTVGQTTELDPIPLAIAMVMDNSGSMGDQRARAVQEAAAIFIGKKGAADGLALIRYDHHTQVEMPLTTDAGSLAKGLQRNGLEGFGGGTAILSGSSAAIAHLASAGSGYQRKAVVVFTDGQENSSSISQKELIDQAIRENIPICAVDFGDGINQGYMEKLARSTGGFYQHIYRTNEFEDLFEDIYRRLRNSYRIEYPHTGYGKHTVAVTLCWGKDTLMAMGSYDNTPEPGKIALLDVFFETGKATLTNTSKRAVSNVTSLLKAMPGMQIEVRGHTDSTNNTGDSTFNRTLSEHRAKAVKEALVKNGIDAQRITATGFGDSMPIASNSTEEGRARNRRTEFVIIKH